jgi:hypothetical protein
MGSMSFSVEVVIRRLVQALRCRSQMKVNKAAAALLPPAEGILTQEASELVRCRNIPHWLSPFSRPELKTCTVSPAEKMWFTQQRLLIMCV